MLQENTALEQQICHKTFKADLLIIFLTLFISQAQNAKDEDRREIFSSLKSLTLVKVR